MCGIAGFVDPVSSSGSGRVARRMGDAIAHRGPDDSGHFLEAPAFLAHRRLSIIDLATGHQPMTNEDGSLWIVYNGEIFNHADVRRELETAGHRYSTRCDTETILHAYEQYGAGCVQQFRGMFAFAIWDRNARRLFCARDRLGIKPFYYYWDGRLFAFASEIKALLEHPGIGVRYASQSLSEYLAFGYLSGEQTMFEGIRKLMPGHTLTLDLAPEPSLHIRQYWDVPPPGAYIRGSEQEWIRETRRRLEETVRMRLMSDVPLGMFLSGGVDSSAIAGLMKRMVDGPVETFSVGYSETAYSELAYARQAAEAIGTHHHEVLVGMEDFFNALPRLVWHEDEPVAWPSSVSLYFVSKLAASRVKVVLTGEGSDELFAGYARHAFYARNRRIAAAYATVPSFIRSGILAFLRSSSLLTADLRRKALHTVLGRDPGIHSLYLDNFYCAFSAAELRDWLPCPSGDAYAAFLRYWDSAPANSFLGRMLYADQKTYLHELLMKQDQMSMASSIESRVPLLDHTFVEFAASIPPALKLRGRQGKYIFKKAVEGLVPNEIVYRKKMGFPTPLRDWMMDARAAPLFQFLFKNDGLIASHIDMGRLSTLVERHRRGREDATDRLWRLINLQLWGDIFLLGRRERWWDGMLKRGQTSCAV
jgi:asparagine synthase (glutamine-hydrolysing)